MVRLTHQDPGVTKVRFQALSAIVAVGLSMGAFAAIGPVTDLVITDDFVQPDGAGLGRQAVLAGGTFPGPLITGNTVRVQPFFNYFSGDLPRCTM